MKFVQFMQLAGPGIVTGSGNIPETFCLLCVHHPVELFMVLVLLYYLPDAFAWLTYFICRFVYKGQSMYDRKCAACGRPAKEIYCNRCGQFLIRWGGETDGQE